MLAFFRQVPVEDLSTLYQQLRDQGPFKITSVELGDEQEEVDTARIRLAGQEALVMQVAVDGDGRIAGLFFRPDPEATPVPVYDSFEALSEDLAPSGTAHVYVAEVTDGACTTTYEDPESAIAAPLGFGLQAGRSLRGGRRGRRRRTRLERRAHHH